LAALRVAGTIEEAYDGRFASAPVSSFDGVAVNRPVLAGLGWRLR